MVRDFLVVSCYRICVVIVFSLFSLHAEQVCAAERSSPLMVFVDYNYERLGKHQRDWLLAADNDSAQVRMQSTTVREGVQSAGTFSYYHLLCALEQSAAPILIYGKHLFDNILVAARAAQAFVVANKTWNFDVDMLERELFPSLDLAMGQREKNKEAILEICKMIEYRALNFQSLSRGFVFACYFLYRHLIEQWHIFESGQSYLLIPRSYASSRAGGLSYGQEMLEQCGFNGSRFEQKNIEEMHEYHDQFPGGYVAFERQLEQELEQTLGRKNEKAWYVCLLGHGQYGEIAGVSADCFCRALSVLQEKGAAWVHVVSCFFGPKNLALISQGLEKRLGGKKGKGEQLILSSGASGDCEAMIAGGRFCLESIDRYFNYFSRLGNHIHTVFPLVASVRYDRFFPALESLHRQYADKQSACYQLNKHLLEQAGGAFMYATSFSFGHVRQEHEPTAMPHIALAPEKGQMLRFYPIRLDGQALVKS